MAEGQASELNAESPGDGNGINVNQNERLISAIVGVALVVYGLTRRSWPGAIVALLGSALLHRGVTGHCYGYGALGMNTNQRDEGEDGGGVKRGIVVEETIIVERPRAEVFAFWRDFENFPKFMEHLKEVTVKDSRNSHWVAVGPLGTGIDWDALITDETPDEMIAWRSLPESEVHTTGMVRFADEGDGTRIEVSLQYDPPGGRLGAIVARLFGEEPSQQVEEDLQRFKKMMEAGAVAS